MDVIPVIDVQHGVAVQATRGLRADYCPLQTPLAPNSDPVAVALGLRSVFAFPTLYIADLDAIEGRGRNADLPERLAAALPDVALWIDDGASPSQASERILSYHRADVSIGSDSHSRHAGEGRYPRKSPHPLGGVSWVPASAGMTLRGGARDRSNSAAESDSIVTMVLGSESLESAEDVATLRSLPADSYVLSLDFKEDRFVGAPAVIEEVALWPRRVIVMTLARVGSNEGPDLERIANIVARASGRQVFAAGGVRNAADVEALRAIGACGVLVATALHSGAITAGDLEKIAGR